jgi:hypothetical protein
VGTQASDELDGLLISNFEEKLGSKNLFMTLSKVSGATKEEKMNTYRIACVNARLRSKHKIWVLSMNSSGEMKSKY